VAKKFYVVWQGRETGIFTEWNICKKQIEKFPGARYKSFKTKEEAEAAFNGHTAGSSPTSSRSSRSTLSGTGPAKKPSTRQTVKTYTAADIAVMDLDTKIYTDGGCEPNPGEAGSGVAVYRNNKVTELWYGLYNPKGTNNTAELNALHQALIMAKDEIKNDKSVAIFCDSKYSIQCVTQWAVSWEKKGWKKQGGEIKNLDLIKEMFALHQQLKTKVKVLHVNGHVGVEGNELADRMSIMAMQSKERDFSLFQEEINIKSLLALRSG
jgi:ribonuclease HI